MNMTKRTWIRSEDAIRQITWTSDDGRATVQVLKVEGGWKVEFSEDGQWLGSEPTSPFRSGAVAVARKWLEALGRPMV